MNVIIIAAIALLVLVVLAIIFINRMVPSQKITQKEPPELIHVEEVVRKSPCVVENYHSGDVYQCNSTKEGCICKSGGSFSR